MFTFKKKSIFAFLVVTATILLLFPYKVAALAESFDDSLPRVESNYGIQTDLILQMESKLKGLEDNFNFLMKDEVLASSPKAKELGNEFAAMFSNALDKLVNLYTSDSDSFGKNYQSVNKSCEQLEAFLLKIYAEEESRR